MKREPIFEFQVVEGRTFFRHIIARENFKNPLPRHAWSTFDEQTIERLRPWFLMMLLLEYAAWVEQNLLPKEAP